MSVSEEKGGVSMARGEDEVTTVTRGNEPATLRCTVASCQGEWEAWFAEQRAALRAQRLPEACMAPVEPEPGEWQEHETVRPPGSA